ncbi:hypothetical protein D3C85_1690740 [compost metagenome]
MKLLLQALVFVFYEIIRDLVARISRCRHSELFIFLVYSSQIANIFKEARYPASGLVKPHLYIAGRIPEHLFRPRELLAVAQGKADDRNKNDKCDHQHKNPFISKKT